MKLNGPGTAKVAKWQLDGTGAEEKTLRWQWTMKCAKQLLEARRGDAEGKAINALRSPGLRAWRVSGRQPQLVSPHRSAVSGVGPGQLFSPFAAAATREQLRP